MTLRAERHLSLAQVGEEALLAWLREEMTCLEEHVLLGPGDDGAVLAPSQYREVVSVDSLVEGVHFRREWMSWRDVGWKAFAASVSDLAAMGAKARAALVALTAPSEMKVEEFLEVAQGLRECARAFDCPIVGGNLSRAPLVSLTTTVLGEGEKLAFRKRAKAGDIVWVSGQLGNSRAALLALLQGKELDRRGACYRAFCHPEPRVREAHYFVEHFPITSLMDLSDGLFRDLPRLVPQGAEIDIGAVPYGGEFARLICEAGREPPLEAARGGEDYELVGTIGEESFRELQMASKELFQLLLTPIGRVTEAGGIFWQWQGKRYTPSEMFEHFS